MTIELSAYDYGFLRLARQPGGATIAGADPVFKSRLAHMKRAGLVTTFRTRAHITDAGRAALRHAPSEGGN